MDSKLRTIFIGLLSLAAVLVIYLLYSRVSKAPQIDIDIEAKSVDEIAESSVDDFNDEIGKIADVGISALTKPVFRHLSSGRVDREFGFEELLHEEKGEWEVEKPYLNIYQNHFKCFVTADRGKVQIETAVGRPNPKDATFSSNVVIHILPETGSDINESFIYLDDVAFASEKSLLSTTGPVRFVSRNAQMLGSGMELIYNDQLERLELLRIIHLATLLFKESWTASFSQTKQDGKLPAQPTVADDAQKQEGTTTTIKQGVEQAQGEYYKCVFNKNVVIDAPEQLVFAEDRVSINNIFWSRASDREPSEAETADGSEVTARVVTPPKHSEPPKPPEEIDDTVVTCENDVVIMPMNSSRVQNSSDKLDIEVRQGRISDKNHLKKLDNTTGRTTLITRKIDYDVSTGDAVALGRSELTFYLSSTPVGAENEETPTPVKVTAQKQTNFLSAAKQVTFEGDCVCTTLQTEPNNIQQKYTLSAPKLIANLESQVTNGSSRIEHVTADGGTVKLKSVKTAKGKLLSGVELECYKTHYNADQELFIATGPGTIKLNNSNVSEPNEQLSRFSLRRPCYAFLSDFATLKYFIKANRIIADAQPGQTLQIDYFPVVEGKYGQQIIITAAHAEVDLVQTTDGQNELSMLTALGGITYKEDKGNELLGSKLFYDREKSILKVEGDEAVPCYFNGAHVERIIYDLKTGRVEAPIAGPGTLQMK